MCDGDVVIRGARVVRPGKSVGAGEVVVRAGKIARGPAAPGARVIEARGKLLTPGLIDVHTHGVGLNLYERSGEEMVAAGEVLGRFGTTCVLPTLYRVMNRKSLGHLEKLAGALGEVRGVRMPGFHLEGPFLALPGAGAETIAGDVGLVEELYAACGGKVVAMSVSPDTPAVLPVIEWLAERGVVVLMTHTRASAEQTEAAIAAGARHATHFYDVFPAPEVTEGGVRPVGAVEAILADQRVSVDFICDGVHVHPVAIRAALAAKGFEGVIAITDSNIGAGLGEGEYETPWGFKVRVKEGDGARIADRSHKSFGGLAGSALTMDGAVRNLRKWLKIGEEQVWAMGTCNPARVFGLRGVGVIEEGAEGDLVLWDEQGRAVVTMVGGEIAYESGPQIDADFRRLKAEEVRHG